MLDNISLEGACALATLAFAFLSLVCGGAWWASAIHGQIGQLLRELRAINQQLSKYQADQKHVNADIYDQLGDHSHRITKVEAKIGL